MKATLAPFLIFTGLVTSFSAVAGGFSGSGGGGGLACFPTEIQAQQADPYLTAGEALPQSLVDQAQIRVLEGWEMQQQGYSVWSAEAGQSWQEHLQNVEGVLRAEFPLFMFRLDQVGDWAKLQSWTEDENIPLLEDATPIKPVPANCRRIQIAIRYSEGNNGIGEGPATNLPSVRVAYVKRYFAKLPEADKAMLALHEKLYMLGQAEGRSNSDSIRMFVRIFFDSSTARMRGQAGHILMDNTLWIIKNELIDTFGDYVIYFSDHYPLAAAAPMTGARHFATFFAFIGGMRSRLTTCDQIESVDVCRKKIMNPLALEGKLPPEEAFLYVAFFGLERSFHKLNADKVMDPTDHDDPNFHLAMDTSCDMMESLRPVFAAKKLLASALTYCDRWHSTSAGYNPGK